MVSTYQLRLYICHTFSALNPWLTHHCLVYKMVTNLNYPVSSILALFVFYIHLLHFSIQKRCHFQSHMRCETHLHLCSIYAKKRTKSERASKQQSGSLSSQPSIASEENSILLRSCFAIDCNYPLTLCIFLYYKQLHQCFTRILPT